MSDQQNIFESYMKLNEDLGLGPKQDGKGINNMPTIGSTGKPGVGHMDPAKSSLTPATGAEDEETGSDDKVEKVQALVENMINVLGAIQDRLESKHFTDENVKCFEELFDASEKIDNAHRTFFGVE